MKTASRRGAALAYVIVVSAVLMILAAALIFSAKFNLDFSKNGLEGRQAYLDAKSAIEYGRSYVLKNPDTGDFTIVKNTGDLGFAIGHSGDAGEVASYNSAKKLISASAKYLSSDRVRKLGYQFTTEESGEDESSNLHDFLIASNGYGTNEIFNTYTQTFSKDATSIYPVVSHLFRMTTDTNKLTAPQIYFLGKSNGDSVIIYDSDVLTLKSDFIYIDGGINSFENWLHVYQPFYLQTYSGSGNTKGVIFFGKDVIKDGRTIAKGGGYYYFRNNVNLYNLASGDLEEVEESKLPAYVNQEKVDFIVNNSDDLITGDSWNPNQGTNWSGQGIISGTLTNQYGGNGYVPPYVTYKKQIEQYTNIQSGKLCRVNYDSNHHNEDAQIVYWYLNDVSGWGNALLGNNNPSSDNIFTNVSNVYYAKEINLHYVNASTDFKISGNKTVVFKADKIMLSTEYNDAEIGSGDSRPKITHSGSTAKFILEAQNADDSVQLYVPNPIQVQYKDSNEIMRKYQIKSGQYEVTQLNLFSDEAKEFFNNTEPEDGSSGGTGGSGNSGTEITGGVYTDGQ
nr:hypothetical protein [uncultured Caproiciproducens sp.]